MRTGGRRKGSYKPYRMFNGKKFWLSVCGDHRKDAEQDAAYRRTTGHFARVVTRERRIPGGWGKEYCVFLRKKKQPKKRKRKR